MPKKTLCPTHLNFQPRPTYPYAPGTAGGGFVFTAGQVAWDETGEVTGVGDVVAQTEQTLHNVLSVLEEGGASPADVLKCTVYLKNIEDFQKMNDVFSRIFGEMPPARTTVQAHLTEPTMLVEIEAIAFVGES